MQFMSGKTAEDLRAVRQQLVEERCAAAYRVSNQGPHKEALKSLALVHQAILSIDEVIASGAAEPDPPETGTQMFFLDR